MKKTAKCNPHAIIVLGMHRSGTSALIRMVNLRGVDLGRNLMAPNVDNEIGFWEHMDIYRINEKLLKDLNSSWDDVRSLPEGWWDSEAAQRYKLEIINILERDFAESPFWGVKDPRICRFLPVWRPLLEQMGCKPYFLIIIRNPLEVVSSLAKRDGFSQGKSCLLWLKHIIDSEKGTRNTPRLFVTYEELLSDWKGLMSRAQKSFQFKWPVTLKNAGPEIASFLQKGLRHNIVNDSILIEDKVVSRWVKDLYFETKGAVNGDDSQLIKSVTAIEAELKDANGLYEPAVADIWARYQASHAMLQERNQQLDDIRIRLEGSNQDRGYQLSTINNLQTAIREKNERIQQLDAELTGLRDKFRSSQEAAVARETQFANLQSKAKEREERIQQLDTEVVELRDQLSTVQQTVVRRETEFTHLQTAITEKNAHIQQLDADLMDLRSKFTSSQEAGSAREAQFANLQSKVKEREERIQQLDTEVVELRDQLSEVQKTVVRRETEATHLQTGIKDRNERIQQLDAELTNLRNELALSQRAASAREARFVNLHSKIKERDERIQKLGTELSALSEETAVAKESLSARETEVKNLHIGIVEKDERIHELNAGVGRLKDEVGALRTHVDNLRLNLEAISNSTSLKLTSPLRWVYANVRKVKRKIKIARYLLNRQYRLIDKSGLFDAAYYLDQNPDIAESEMNPLSHYLRLGASEGRDPNPLFDTSYYLEQNPDIAESGMNPLVHYLRIGAGEGRDPNPLFDTSYYLEQNPDIAESGLNPLVHYLNSGAVEGRDPNPFFDTSYYLAQNPDVAESGMNPLAHYHKYASIESGKVIKIVPSPAKVYHHSDNIELNEYYLSISGWAVSNIEIERIGIYIDDIFIGSAKYGWPRKDIEKAFPSIRNALYSGFTFFSLLDKIDIQNNETYQITVRTMTKDGLSSVLCKSTVCRGYSYKEFIEYILPNNSNYDWMEKVSKNFLNKYHFTITLVITEINIPNIDKTIKSLLSQTYPNYNILIFYENELPYEILKCFKNEIDESKLQLRTFRDLNKIIQNTKTDYLSFILPGDLIMPQTLFEVAKVLNIDRTIDLIYTDESVQSDDKTARPIFKPGWSPDLLLSKNYIGDFFITKKKFFERSEDLLEFPFPEGLHNLLLKLTELTDLVYHIPLPLFTKGPSHNLNLENSKKLLENALQRRKIKGKVIPLSNPGTFRIKRAIIGNPKVSIIMPTGYKNPDKNIKPCLKSIVEKSTYTNYEIVIIDNSFGKFSLHEIKEIIPDTINLKIISYDKKYNFSEIYNLAIPKAQGDYCLLLNDDTEVISPEWIEALLENAQRPEVAVVGAKLLYMDKTIQHAGIFLVDNEGGSRHYGRNFEQNSNVNNGLLQVTRNCTATTFGCVMISKDVYLKMNGLEPRFPIECNDTDFCLRAISLDYLIVWTPFALLFHKEIATREEIDVPEDKERFWNQWGKMIRAGDKFYNPNLTLESDNLTFNNRPILIEHHEPSITTENCSKNLSSSNPIIIESIKKVLVIKLDHIGDVILSLPAIKILREKFPEAHITLLSGSWAKTIVESIKEIDDYIIFDFFYEKSEKGGCPISDREIKELENLLFSKNFDLALDLRRHKETRKILKLSGATYTVGFSTGEDDSWMTICLEIPEKDLDIPGQITKSHISAQLCKLVLCIPSNAPIEIQSALPIIDLPFETDNRILKDHSKLFGSNLMIGIHPGTGALIRQWPPTHYANLADILIEEKNANIVFFGGKEDKQLVDSIIGLMNHKKKAVSLAGTTTLTEFMTVLKKCHLFIGNVSGPGHLSGILGVPTLIIFAGTVLPQEWQPLGEKTLSIRMKIFCAPCYKSIPEQCPIGMKCLKFLWPEKVIGAVNQLLAISG